MTPPVEMFIYNIDNPISFCVITESENELATMCPDVIDSGNDFEESKFDVNIESKVINIS